MGLDGFISWHNKKELSGLDNLMQVGLNFEGSALVLMTQDDVYGKLKSRYLLHKGSHT